MFSYLEEVFMLKEDLENLVGSVLYAVVLESFIDTYKKKGKIRVKPVASQGILQTLYVSCSKKRRASFPVGTRFKADLKLCRTIQGQFYLNSVKPSVLMTEEEYGKQFLPAKQLLFKFS